MRFKQVSQQGHKAIHNTIIRYLVNEFIQLRIKLGDFIPKKLKYAI